MRRIAVLTTLLTTLALIAAACGEGESQIMAVAGNSELAPGPNRFTMGLIDEKTGPILGGPNTSVQLRFLSPSGSEGDEVDTRFVWAIPDQVGFWAADVVFDEPGAWNVEATLTQDGKNRVVNIKFRVQEESQSPAVGQGAPPTVNLTINDVADIKEISTDTEPDLSFYQMTVADALQTGKPLVIVFATPAFCETQFCGPIVQQVRGVSPDYAGEVNFIHIEPYELDESGGLATGASGPVLSAPMLEWNFVSEPWVYVIDADGLVATRFEGAIGSDELRSAIEDALG